MEEEYAQGTLSHFIQRKRKYTLLDFLNEAGLDNYHRLTRCAQFVASIQPVTSRVESMFSFQRHTEHVNMSPETLEATMMLKMDKCGGVRRIFNNWFHYYFISINMIFWWYEESKLLMENWRKDENILKNTSPILRNKYLRYVGFFITKIPILGNQRVISQ